MEIDLQFRGYSWKRENEKQLRRREKIKIRTEGVFRSLARVKGKRNILNEASNASGLESRCSSDERADSSSD